MKLTRSVPKPAYCVTSPLFYHFEAIFAHYRSCIFTQMFYIPTIIATTMKRCYDSLKISSVPVIV